MLNTVRWLLPIIVFPLAWLAARKIPYKKQRFIIYSILVCLAFVQAVVNVVLSNTTLDTLWLLILLFIISELFWGFNRFKSKPVFITLIFLYCIGYFAFLSHWILSGSKSNGQYWHASTLEEKSMPHGSYAIKITDIPYEKKRLLTLYKKLAIPQLERRVDTYKTQAGYYQTPFSCKWTDTYQGVRVDLIADGQVIWSLGEGL